MNATPVTSTGRLPWLDVLRGVAAFAVVLHHIYAISVHYYATDSTLLDSPSVRVFMHLSRWGVLGVPCFFVLSGFCVGQTWQRAKSSSQFALRRWRRIFPPYYASLALVLGCVLAVKLCNGVNDITTLPAPTPANLLATLTLMTAPASHVPTLTWVYWTLSYEVVFYVLLSALLLVPGSWRRRALCLVHAVICLLGVWPGLKLNPGLLFFVDLWPLFGLGLALTLASHSRPAALIIGLVSVLATCHLIGVAAYANFAWAGFAATALVAVSAAGPPAALIWPLEKLGEFSYSLYLIHVPILLSLGKYLVLRPQQTPGWFFAGASAAASLMVAAAFGFYWLCERPFTVRPVGPMRVQP